MFNLIFYQTFNPFYQLYNGEIMSWYHIVSKCAHTPLLFTGKLQLLITAEQSSSGLYTTRTERLMSLAEDTNLSSLRDKTASSSVKLSCLSTWLGTSYNVITESYEHAPVN